MSRLDVGLFAAAGSAALVYGVVFLQRPPSLPRTLTKAAGAASLAVAARFSDAPGLLPLGLALCAVGDACLAGDPKTWLPAGIVVFLVAHLALVALFLEIGALGALTAEPWRAGVVAVAAIWCVGLVVHLWSKFGPLKAAGIAYALALLTTVASALTLPVGFHWAMAGAGLFLASDSILAVRLFRYEAAPHRLWDHLVWWLYAGAIGLIAWSFLHG